MTSSGFLKRLVGALIVAICISAAPAIADTVFTDSTFNLAGYSESSQFISGAGDSLVGVQCASCGNPGQALQITTTLPNPGDGAAQSFMNNLFVFAPSVGGAITSISFSVDKNLVFNQSADPSAPFGNTARPTIEQDGVFYVAAIPGPGTLGGGVPTGFNTFSATLSATDFLNYNFTTGTFGTSNPNFDGDPMAFGLTQIFGIGTTSNNIGVATYDNMRYDIVSTPEPASILMLAVGLGAMLLFGLARRAKGISVA